MMVELNEQQTDIVEQLIDESELSYHPFKEELLDHLCSDIESRMQEGDAFSSAIAQAFDTFPKDEIKEIEEQILSSINQKHAIMKKVSLLALASLLLCSTFIWAHQQDPPDMSPLGQSFEITSGFGQRIHPIYKNKRMHRGVDFRAPAGTPVMATSDGKVIKAGETYGYGIRIIIQHDESYQTLYAQLSELNVEEGQEVKKGEVIGKVGSSGLSTAPHLHYEVRKDGKVEDPEQYLNP
ncbi:MAG: M23 family metallopeptidase [Cyanothece sp. SIO1E1]|nr:M23 family metallopeptidase [Cyanothece sp. SIO1E1]